MPVRRRPSTLLERWLSSLPARQSISHFAARLSSSTADPLALFLSSFLLHHLSPPPVPAYFLALRRVLLLPRPRTHVSRFLSHLRIAAAPTPTPEPLLSSLLRSLARRSLFPDAVNLFFAMPSLRCSPSVASLDTLLSSLGESESGVEYIPCVVARLPEVGVRLEESSFRVLSRGLCRFKKFDAALEILRAMWEEGCQPEGGTSRTVLRAFGRRVSGEEVVALMKEMNCWGVFMGVPEYNAAIGAFVRERRMEEAFDVFATMVDNGLRPDVGSYNLMMEGNCSLGSFSTVGNLFDEMLVKGIQPNVGTYNVYISSACGKGDFGEGRMMLEAMERAGCAPDVRTFNVLIAAYLGAADFTGAKDVIETMLRRGLRWDSCGYSDLISAVSSKGKAVVACSLLADILRNNKELWHNGFGALVCAICEEHCLELAVRLLEEMIGKSVPPDGKCWSAVLNVLKPNCDGIDTALIEDDNIRP